MLSAIYTAAKSPIKNKIFNVGSGKSIQVKKLLNIWVRLYKNIKDQANLR